MRNSFDNVAPSQGAGQIAILDAAMEINKVTMKKVQILMPRGGT